MDLSKLPSTYYRVTIKAIIFDNQNRLLVGYINDEVPGWEIPGGGWDFDETLPDCIRRELKEEFGVNVKNIGTVRFVYRNKTGKGYPKVNIAVDVELENNEFHFGDMIEAKFVNKSQLLALDFGGDEGAVKDYVDFIWPTR